jgi:peptidoglycan-N-acetylglucosamine deacetylase
MKLFIKLIVVFLFCALLLGCSSDAQKVATIPSSKTNSETKDIPDKIPTNLTKPADGINLNTKPTQVNTVLQKIIYNSDLSKIKQVALTFDDGPDVKYTSQILDILKSYNIKATFFILGEKALEYPEMVKKIINEGHVIGNHTWDHHYLSNLNATQVKDEVKKDDQVLFSIAGYHTMLFRPPYGAASKNVISEVASMGYHIIDWSVDTRDWAGTPASTILKYVSNEVRPGGIILQHCSGGRKGNLDNTIKALPEIISMLEAKNYHFVTVPELLNYPAQNQDNTSIK